MALLPNASQAVVPKDKLVRYILNPEHEKGRHKARVFRSTLGFGPENWEDLRDQILDGVLSAEISKVATGVHGTRYTVPLLIEGTNGETHEVTTGWIVEEDAEEERAKLTSAYVNVP